MNYVYQQFIGHKIRIRKKIKEFLIFWRQSRITFKLTFVRKEDFTVIKIYPSVSGHQTNIKCIWYLALSCNDLASDCTSIRFTIMFYLYIAITTSFLYERYILPRYIPTKRMCPIFHRYLLIYCSKWYLRWKVQGHLLRSGQLISRLIPNLLHNLSVSEYNRDTNMQVSLIKLKNSRPYLAIRAIQASVSNCTYYM